MPIFDTKRFRKWLAKECRDLGHGTLDSMIAERSRVFAAAAPTPRCVKFPMLMGMEPVTNEAHDMEDCEFCRSILRHYYIFYATKKEMQPYVKIVARKNDMSVAATKRAIGSTGFKGGIECFDAVDAANFAVLPPERQGHRDDYIRCNLRVELWNAMNDIELRR